MHSARRVLVLTAALIPTLTLGAPLRAQIGATPVAPPPCGTGNGVARALVGGSLGAWLGFFAMKVRYSDWSDASRTTSARTARVQGTVVGALVGASIGRWGLPASCGARTGTASPRVPGRYVLTADEVRQAGVAGSVYDVVFALRQHWLSTRGVELSETPSVTLDERGAQVTSAVAAALVTYLDNVRLGDQEQLRAVPISGVLAVRYYDAAQATLRFGAGHRHGVIQVITIPDESPRIVAPDQRR